MPYSAWQCFIYVSKSKVLPQKIWNQKSLKGRISCRLWDMWESIMLLCVHFLYTIESTNVYSRWGPCFCLQRDKYVLSGIATKFLFIYSTFRLINDVLTYRGLPSHVCTGHMSVGESSLAGNTHMCSSPVCSEWPAETETESPCQSQLEEKKR